jgi:agmatinase
MRTFAGIENEYSEYDSSSILLQSIPYDGTSTWGKGSDNAFMAFLEASENMELYDIETNTEVYKNGIHILPEISEKSSPEAVYSQVYKRTKELLTTGKFLTFFGGEHSISIGIIKAFYEKFKDLTVVQLDAHADLRKTYLGSKYNHACALFDASHHTNLIQVGIRSMDKSETKNLDWARCILAEDINRSNKWVDHTIDLMTENIYITFDLDVFDPSIMPSTGTPEPGGLDWYTVVNYLKEIFKSKNVVGFDIVELCPIPALKSPDFLAAKLYYKMLSYKINYHEE